MKKKAKYKNVSVTFFSHHKQDGGDSKRSKGGGQAVTRTPVMTLAGHKEGISGVCWTEDKSTLVSSSWDHTIRIWDTEIGGMKSELVGNKSFFDVAYSPKAKLLITASGLSNKAFFPIHCTFSWVNPKTLISEDITL